MKVRELMSSAVDSCSPSSDLAAAAMIMWRDDCGIVPVVTADTGKLEGAITDRDICMALATSGRRPSERTVGEVMAKRVCTVKADDDVHEALAIMARKRVWRLPVVEPDGALSGMISINDLILATSKGPNRARPAISAEEVVGTLRGICAHRIPAREEAPIVEEAVQV